MGIEIVGWPHAPAHQFEEAGTYMVTASTYKKSHHFSTRARLERLQSLLFGLADQYGWRLQAWAVFSNHYHFVADSTDDSASLRALIRDLHSITAHEVNRVDEAKGRKVWFQYWDSQITYESSYLARLNYVHQNPVRHGLVPVANLYPFCSASWFERLARPAFAKTVLGLKTERVKVPDDFAVIIED